MMAWQFGPLLNEGIVHLKYGPIVQNEMIFAATKSARNLK